jgi:putative hydrolase of the HAD superfamily
VIKGIIFDLGSTLIRFSGDWPEVVHAGAAAMADWYLQKKHLKLDGPALIETFIQEREANRIMAQESQTEVLAQHSLLSALNKISAPPTAAAVVEAALKTYFGPEEAAWQPYPEAPETLKLLQRRGYRLGLYSNATDDKLVQRLVNQACLRPWLSPTFSSAGWGWRKPKPEPFDLIARRWGLPAEQIVVVGDTLNTDILGAQAAGMPSILVTMDEAASNEQHRHILPVAVVDNLAALPEMIARW